MMEFVDMVMDAIQSQLFQTIGLVVIVISLAGLEKRCKEIEKGIESLRRPVASAPERELDGKRMVVAEEPNSTEGVPCPPHATGA